MSYKDVWILGEQEEGQIKLVSYELLKRGRALAEKLGVDLIAVILGKKIGKNGIRELIYRGADKIIIVEDPVLEFFLPEPYVNTIEDLVNKYKPEIFIASATTTGRTVAPALAIKCNTGLTADCTGLDIEEGTGNLIQTRPAIGGNILATIKTPNHRPQMATVRPHSNKPLESDSSRTGEVTYETVDQVRLKSRTKRLRFKKNAEESGNIQDAEIIIAGGKGFKKDEKFKMVQDLASILNGAFGATRDAVDLGWATYPHQIGLSGKTVSPKLYIAAGISGSVQHLAGIKTSETIIAINNDPEAQIFQVADFGIVGDLFEILPLFKQKLQAIKKGRETEGFQGA
ncbi:MAG: electron transfer flavoprotein subunit alpha/FixB family protein [Desulfobacteraceae bacterium]|nr:electron transfer flavoprotein subunit alpha/FixB family protein [Desulfobacteraceae bacterium]